MNHKRSILAILFLSILALAFSFPVTAQESEFFHANQFQVDLFGGAVTRDFDKANVDLGLGAGAAYYISRQFGLGVSTFTTDDEHHLVDQVSWDLLARQPIGDRFAPYLFLGGDFNFERDDFLAHSGAGLEFRLTRNVGLFADARYESDFQSLGQAVGRSGLRLTW